GITARLHDRGSAPRAPDPRLLRARPHRDGPDQGARRELQDQGHTGIPRRLRRDHYPATPAAQRLRDPDRPDYRALASPGRRGAHLRRANRLQAGRL
ncbi:MAG: hypothetical protein AVDCRST_MAG14-2168, partial [uncultured Rubrobacteraceae bacterium]